MSEYRMITAESIGQIAMKAARLLASGKIDNATARRIITATERALNALRAGKAMEDKTVAELLEAEKILNQK
jgi:hypothetical protein